MCVCQQPCCFPNLLGIVQDMKGSQALALLPRGFGGLSCLPSPLPEQHTLLVGISGGDGLCKSVARDNKARTATECDAISLLTAVLPSSH